MKENDIVVLTIDITKSNLKSGDLGVIVMCHRNGEAFEVEFVKFNGETISVECLEKQFIRHVSNDEIPHVRLIKVA
ncbi:MAG: hypothetical protein FD143_1182 [Ignavibacteria bacterium]|nr:MAG: hypothetical protein FD143_1182 [Ignavibacteria bacterium]KAF0160692.1 MAG: hypothetical protein FD188_1468 [Ignavibacteria bacterium]